MTFRIKWHGRYVGTVARIIGLGPMADPSWPHGPAVQRGFRGPLKGGNPGPIILERAAICDPEFRARLNDSSTNADQPTRSPINLVFEAVNECGGLVNKYSLSRCRVGDYTSIPTFDAKANMVAIDALIIYHDAWESD